MADMDSLLGSRISLISLQDVRYDGVLYSINQKESSIVLRDVRCLGTEDRVHDVTRKVLPNPNSMPFVSFPGSDIKDLFVHDNYEETFPVPNIPNAATAFGNSSQSASLLTAPTPEVHQQAPVPPRQTSQRQENFYQPQQPLSQQPQPQSQQPQPQSRLPPFSALPTKSKLINMAPTNPWGNPNVGGKKTTPPISLQSHPQMQQRRQQNRVTNSNGNIYRSNVKGGRGDRNDFRTQREPQGVAGTGEYLQKLRNKKNADGSLAHGIDVKKDDFDFNSGLSVFNKAEVLASVAANEDLKQSVYQKDDFFDSLSCEILDREEGRKTRMTAYEERSLNQDTFGATALQSSYRRFNGGRNGGRGRGGRGRSNNAPSATIGI